MQLKQHVWRLTGDHGDLFAVVCENHKEACFQESAHLAQHAVCSENKKFEDFIECDDVCFYDDDGDKVHAHSLSADIEKILEAVGADWLWPFQICTVKSGARAGTKAVAIGSNQTKLQRASRLAIAVSVAHELSRNGQSDPELASVASLPVTDIGSGAPDEADPEPAPISENVNSNPWSSYQASRGQSPSNCSDEGRSPLVEQWLSADDPVDIAKQRLIQHRRNCQAIEQPLGSFVEQLLKGRITSDDGHNPKCEGDIGTHSHLAKDLWTVSTKDTWKGSSCGDCWIRDWMKWQSPFTNPEKALCGKVSKRASNYRWYFGVDPPTASDAEQSSSSETPPSSRSPRQAATSGRPVPPPPPPPRDQKPTPPPPPRGQKPPPPPPPPRPSSPKDDEHSTQTAKARAVSGTAEASSSPAGAAVNLSELNLQCRVLDGENIGFSYGKEVAKTSRYGIEGIKRAVQYFLDKNMEVIVVTRRQETATKLHKYFKVDELRTVIGEATDDVIVLRQAFRKKCPIVSRDKFQPWLEDTRLGQDVRQWLAETNHLKVRYYWDADGEFDTDWDLQPDQQC